MSFLLIALMMMLTEASVVGQEEGQGQRGQGQQGGRQGRQGQTSSMMRLFDADGDGAISMEEINGAVAILKKIDKDGDGSLSAEELRVEGGGQRGQDRGRRGPDGDNGGGGDDADSEDGNL